MKRRPYWGGLGMLSDSESSGEPSDSERGVAGDSDPVPSTVVAVPMASTQQPSDHTSACRPCPACETYPARRHIIMPPNTLTRQHLAAAQQRPLVSADAPYAADLSRPAALHTRSPLGPSSQAAGPLSSCLLQRPCPGPRRLTRSRAIYPTRKGVTQTCRRTSGAAHSRAAASRPSRASAPARPTAP